MQHQKTLTLHETGRLHPGRKKETPFCSLPELEIHMTGKNTSVRRYSRRCLRDAAAKLKQLIIMSWHSRHRLRDQRY